MSLKHPVDPPHEWQATWDDAEQRRPARGEPRHRAPAAQSSNAAEVSRAWEEARSTLRMPRLDTAALSGRAPDDSWRAVPRRSTVGQPAAGTHLLGLMDPEEGRTEMSKPGKGSGAPGGPSGPE